jgi:hypothetical protein
MTLAHFALLGLEKVGGTRNTEGKKGYEIVKFVIHSRLPGCFVFGILVSSRLVFRSCILSIRDSACLFLALHGRGFHVVGEPCLGNEHVNIRWSQCKYSG